MTLTAIAGFATALPLTTSAADLGYTYAEVRYLDVDLPNEISADGFSGIGWYRLNEHFFVLGQLNLVDIDTGADSTTAAIGGGYIRALNDQWDAVAIATARRTEIELGSQDSSDEGYGAQLGLRGMPIPKFETRAFVNYVNVSNSDTSFFLSGDYWFSPVFSAGLAAEFGGDVDTISIGARYAFGN